RRDPFPDGTRACAQMMAQGPALDQSARAPAGARRAGPSGRGRAAESGRGRGVTLGRMSRAALAAALAAACLAGCAGGPARQRSVLAGNPTRNLLVLPLNVAVVMPSELEAARPIVWQELEIYLRAQGKELKTVSPEA